MVDWNPSGLNIFSVYKYGSTDRGGVHCLPGLQWLAVRAEMLHGVPDDALQVRLMLAPPTILMPCSQQFRLPHQHNHNVTA